MLLFGRFHHDWGDHPLGPEQFLARFGNPALVSICFLMMLGHGLVATGALSSTVILIVVSSLAIGEAMTATGLIATAGNSLALLGAYVPPAAIFGTPIAAAMAYQTNLMMAAAAGYRFKDFVRAGLPLAILMWVTLTWLLAREYALI